MNNWFAGKIAGAAVGLWVGGPVGALVGLAVGHAVDHFSSPEDPDETLKDLRPPPPTAREIDARARLAFASHLVALFAAVARSDGAIRREEVRVIRTFFEERLRLTGEDLEFIRRLLKGSLNTPVDVGDACRWYLGHSQPAERNLFVQALYELALADGEMSQSEQRLINEIVVHLGLSERDHRAVRAVFYNEPNLEADYALLGLVPGAEDGELKKAFRLLAAKHHPDKVTHLGPDAVALAARRFTEIKAAYDRIRSARGQA